MEKKAKFFRNVIASSILIIILSVTIALVIAVPSNNSVPTLEPVRGGACSNSVSIAITLDRNASHVGEILNTLRQEGAGVTFFVSGVWAVENTDVLKQIYRDNHSFGNFGFFNVAHKTLSAERIVDEITLTHKLVKYNTGIEMNVFMPPQASYNEATIEIARALGYTVVSPALPNTRRGNASACYANRILDSSQQGGDFIVLPANQLVAGSLSNIINHIRNQNFSIVPIDAVLTEPLFTSR